MAFGRLERTQGDPPMSEINVTPLVDVMLVLVVIFIITAPLLASSIRLDLPRAEGTQAGDAPRFLSVMVDKAGQVFLNDKPVQATQLAAQLATAAKQNPDTEIQLRADQGVSYGKVVEIMGLVHQAGLSRIGFVAEPAKQ
jgi:biopolymer transport protein TolR